MEQRDLNMPIMAEALRASYGTSKLLPIEFFKQHPDALRRLNPGPIARTFLSSGTSGSDRSQSAFSTAGLAVYRQNSIAGFQAVLKHFFDDPKRPLGISLIPDVTEWPDSSLAQMVHWLGEVHRVHYWNGKDLLPAEPIWLFGTAFHFVNLADEGMRLRLPAGSVVIETGGTKGRSRSVTRDELYELISTHLGINKNRIISEYGMCELASQAYDWIDEPNGLEIPLNQRWFRFPTDTPVSIYDRLSSSTSCGEGTLVVHDKLRIDYPWPIRTEDIARVRADGAFQLLGRVPFSPLKGCSMLAEQILGPGRSTQSQLTAARLPQASLSMRAEAAHRMAQLLLNDETFWDLWRAELGSEQAAVWLKADLKLSMPASIADWLAAAEVARGSSYLQRWLIIPPESHSFAWLYPIFLGMVLGFELYLRAKEEDLLVRRVREILEPLGNFAIWSTSNRIGVHPLPPVDAVLLYGTDETIAAVQKICPVPVQGFGSSLTVSLAHRTGKPSLIWKDAFSLLQRGCMASRVHFILQDETLDSDCHESLDSLLAPAQPIGALPLGLELALEHTAFALRCEGRQVLKRACEGAPLLVIEPFDSQKKLSELLIDRAMSLTLVLISKNQWQIFGRWLPMQRNLHKIAVHDKDSLPIALDEKRFEIAEAGKANAPIWDGRHQRRPLFCPG